MRLRRASCLTCYWHEGEFVVHPYPGGTPTALHPAAAEVLAAFDDWVEPAKAAESLDHLTPDTVAEAVQALHEAGALLAEGSDEADRDEKVARRWQTWAPEASFFHYATQDVPYADLERAGGNRQGEADTTPVDTAVSAVDGPSHSMFTEYPDADRVLLPRRPADLRVPYEQVLYARRTHRDFTDDPVPLPTLATLLSTVFGPVDYIDSGRSALFRRTSPAGGSRQELDAYVGILNVTGVDPGMYHYNLREHSLELLSPGLGRDEVVRLGAGQDWIGGVAFLVVLTAVIDRMSSKYHTPRCYRVSLLDAGHLGQTFALTATALGLGPAQTGAFCDTPIAERLGLDNIGHTPLYVLAAGTPHPDPKWAPPRATLDTFRATTLR
ncbi:SagB-type dehydrogenase family enzyme [Saccharothrix tamanrassetensis]|uniref:SagB-type dehydrogenase family enzyme n=1 Tax=Saccharothrix tamanrassetensis TaxID=1051531 RepID=A0A841CDH8_9PSEU|nr:SagB/ThcOx family dehydrogenase [Saccharothrix tamanrassetensis]MBB5954414.1 SagB-type dehydrogenase family enzyme [Saccharothrix tamanrassetensis]